MDGSGQQAEFNDALGFLRRIDAIFREMDQESGNYNVERWAALISELTRELCSYIVKLDDWNKRLFELLKSVENYKTRDEERIPTSLIWEMHLMEIELRLVYNNSGLQMKHKEDVLEGEEEW